MITLHNKTFEVFIPETEISAIVHSMANQINNSGVKNPLFIAVLNGSFLFAADIMRKINIPNCEISFIKLSNLGRSFILAPPLIPSPSLYTLKSLKPLTLAHYLFSKEQL